MIRLPGPIYFALQVGGAVANAIDYTRGFVNAVICEYFGHDMDSVSGTYFEWCRRCYWRNW